MIHWLTRPVGRVLASYLNQPIRRYEPFAITDSNKLAAVLEPGDVLLVEGNRRISIAIKYLTQSTWSHAAIYIGGALGKGADPMTSPTLVEADLEDGVVAVPLGKYARLNIRICRPVGLTEAARRELIDYVIGRLGNRYDLRNVIDLARYLLPTPPVPVYWRRRMLAFGSADPTRAICSTLIAQAYQSIRYPILPRIERDCVHDDKLKATVREILHIRHYSLFAPRDFDISPYFRVIKPAVEQTFDYRALKWAI
jgi:cell wall-associated NlpC family hydrolase